MLAVQVRLLSERGVRQVTLLGQNVNSYADFSAAQDRLASRRHASSMAPGQPDPFATYAKV